MLTFKQYIKESVVLPGSVEHMAHEVHSVHVGNKPSSIEDSNHFETKHYHIHRAGYTNYNPNTKPVTNHKAIYIVHHKYSMAQNLAGDTAHKTHKFHVSHDSKMGSKVHVDHVGSLNNEEAIVELSKKTLGSYVKKAADEVSFHSFTAGSESPKKSALKHDVKAFKRQDGIGKAVNKLTKEEVIDEEDTRTGREPHKKNSQRCVVPRCTKSYNHAGACKKEKPFRDAAVTGKARDFKNEETIIEKYEGMEHMSDAAHELVLHADNHAQLHHGSHMPIINNLKKKMKKGVYDSEKAKKLWGYHADRAAIDYHKQYGEKHTPWHKMFSTADRKQAAAHWEAHHRDELHESVTEENKPVLPGKEPARPGYNADAVNKAIARNPTGKIGRKEARAIHRLLKGRH
jgi:hypothetical protein